MSDKDGKQPGFPEPDQAEPLPLSPNRIPVARFSRRVMILVIALISGVTAISMIFAFSPRKKPAPQEKTAQESAQAASNSEQPGLPECLVGPKGYGEIKTANAPYATPANGVPALGPPLEANLHPGANLSYVAHPAPGQGSNGATLTPEQQAILAREELRRKEALEARRSGLTFEGREPSVQPVTVAGGPVPSGVPSLERLEGLVSRIGTVGASDTQSEGDQNRQDEKRRFAGERRTGSPYLGSPLLKPISPYEIKAGSILPGTLITGINSDLPGQILAQLRENVYDSVTGRYLLLPQGTRLIGEYDSKISYGQERVLVVWSRLILPSGNSVSLEDMPGIDLSGFAGAGGRVNNHYGKLITGVVLGSVVGAGAQIAVGGQGSPNNPASFGQLAVSGAAQNINQAGQQITQKNLNLQPTIEVPSGLKINIFVTKDMILKPVQN